MTPQSESAQSAAFDNLRRAAEARGLTLYLEPTSDLVPAFLGNFRPDAIALGPDGGIVVVELKRPKDTVAGPRLADIAQTVSGQAGWEFQAIYVNPPLDDVPPIARPTPAQLQAAFREIEALEQHGHHAAALLTGWAALESLARLASADANADGAKGMSPLAAIQTLAQEGYVENDVADRLRRLARLRNAVAHGDLSAAVTAEQVAALLGDLRAIAAEIEAAALAAG